MDCLIIGCVRQRKQSRTGVGRYCSMHYERRRRNGLFGEAQPRINFGNAWLGTNGYVKITVGGRETYLHRYIWECANGPIPAGYHIHHRDGNKLHNTLENFEMLPKAVHHAQHTVGRIHSPGGRFRKLVKHETKSS